MIRIKTEESNDDSSNDSTRKRIKPEALVVAPSLAELRKRADKNKESIRQIQAEFDVYAVKAQELLAFYAALEEAAKKYVNLMFEHERLKKQLWGNVRAFRRDNDQHVADAVFLANQDPELHKQYRNVTDQTRSLELKLAEDLEYVLKLSTTLATVIHEDIVDKQLYPAANVAEQAVAEAPLVAEKDLADPHKLNVIIQQISNSFRQAICTALTEYTQNCAQLMAVLESLAPKLAAYQDTVAAYDASKNDLWRIIVGRLKSDEPDFDRVKAFQDFCPTLALVYDKTDDQRRELRAAIQVQLHNATVLRKQRLPALDTPHKTKLMAHAYAATITTQSRIVHRVPITHGNKLTRG